MNGTLRIVRAVCAPAGRILLSAALCAALLGPASCGEEADQALVTRLKTEAPAALRPRAGAADDLHLKFSVTNRYFTSHYEIFSEGKNCLIRTERLPGGEGQQPVPRRLCYLQNAARFYGLAQETEGGPWTIDYHGKVLPETRDTGSAALLLRKISPYYIEARPLAEFLEDAGLKITRIASETAGGAETVTFDFEIPAGALTETDADGRAGGRLTLVPSKDWGIAELALRYTKETGPVLVEKKFTFADGADRPVPVSAMEYKITVRPGTPQSETLLDEQTRYQVCDNARLPRNELSLKYYGLKRPDPRTKSEKRLSRTLMILAGAVILFGLARKYKVLRRDRRFSKKRLRRALRAGKREDPSREDGR